MKGIRVTKQNRSKVLTADGRETAYKFIELTQNMIDTVCKSEFYEESSEHRECDVKVDIPDEDYEGEEECYQYGMYETDELTDALNIIINLKTFESGLYVYHRYDGWSKATPEQIKKISRIKFIRETTDGLNSEKRDLEANL